MEAYMWIVWLSILVIAVVVEAATSGLVSIWFIGGSLVAAILSIIPSTDKPFVPYWGQIIAFVAVSLICFIAFRPLLKRFLSTHEVESNVDEIVGRKGKMSKHANELDHGEVVIHGVSWTAIPADGVDEIQENTIVKVVAVEGNKLIVSPIKERK